MRPLRRVAIVVAALALVLSSAVLGLAISLSGSSTATWYQCANAAGTAEASRGGLSQPTCAHPSDRIASWPVNLPGPVTTTTKSPSSTSVATTSTRVTTTTSGPTTTTSPANVAWHPSSAASITWNWQLQGAISTAAPPQMFDIDGFDNTPATVAALHAGGAKVVCYIDVGTDEPDRPDRALIPAGDDGNPVEGFTTEHWLDIRDLAGLTPLVHERMNMCANKGFDGVEPDDVDGYTNSSGFPLTGNQQLAYNEMVAAQAHIMGLSVALKNDVDQVATLEPFFDWALDEECNAFSECGTLAPFTAAGKAVFNAEYKGNTSTFCPADASKHINGSKFAVALDGSNHSTCPAW